MMQIPQDIKQVSSPSFDSRDGYKVDRLIIHTTEGSYASSVSWLARTPTPPDEGSSAHYVVSEDGSQATQLVDLVNNAWHCGNQIWNKKSVGIENSGYASKGGFSDGLYRTSAKIAAYVCKKFSIVPVHGQTVFAHNDVPQDPANWHTDPGPLWDWTKYMAYIQEELNKLMNTIPPALAPNIGPGMTGYLNNHGLVPVTPEIYVGNGASILYCSDGTKLEAYENFDPNTGKPVADGSWTVKAFKLP